VNHSRRHFAYPFPCLFAFILFLFFAQLSVAQQPPPPAPDAPAQAPATPPSKESSNKKHKSIPGFLILGTVFNERGYAFPGVEVKVRPKGEKKFRYDMYTNSRGEFAVRVPDGIEYEVVVRQKKYKEQSQEIAAKVEEVQKRLTFKLEPVTAAKTGESK
jgi:Carboxypeptidase regulatory-like domain